MKESALPASQGLAMEASAGLGRPWGGALPGAGAAAGASVEVFEHPVRNIGSDIAAKVAEEAFTKVLRENLLFFILVLLLISYKRSCMAFSISSGVTVGSKGLESIKREKAFDIHWNVSFDKYKN